MGDKKNPVLEEKSLSVDEVVQKIVDDLLFKKKSLTHSAVLIGIPLVETVGDKTMSHLLLRNEQDGTFNYQVPMRIDDASIGVRVDIYERGNMTYLHDHQTPRLYKG